MNTVDDDNELGFFEQPPNRPPRERARRPRRTTPRRTGPPAGSNGVLRLAGLVALAIVIVVGFVLWIGSCSGQSSQDYTSYLKAMQPLAVSSAQVGKEFARALGTPGLTMDDFQNDLARWSRQEQANYVAAQRLRPPGPLQSAHAQALATFYLRGAALTNLASHLKLATANHERPSAAAAVLAGDAQLLSTSDVMWEQLYRQPVAQVLTSRNVGNVTVPGSRIVTKSDIVSAPSLAVVYQRLGTPSSGRTVTGVHGTKLLYTNAVENGIAKGLSTTSGVTVAVGPNLVIDVVLQNSGAYPEVQIPVTLSLNGGDKRLWTHTNTVSQLGAGAQTTVSFTDIQVPNSAFSHSGSISVRIHKVPGEAKLDDNAATYQVLFRLAPS
jgi:hypothetical protein